MVSFESELCLCVEVADAQFSAKVGVLITFVFEDGG